MKSSILALLLTVPFLSAGVRAATPTLLEPGIYRLDPDGYLAMPKAKPASYGEIDDDSFEHALPPAARISYAVVARDPGRTQNRVLFLVDGGYHYDVNSPNKLCPAYAFPDWNEYSDVQPFCRTNISGDDAAFNWSTNAFTVSWGSDRKYLRTDYDDKGESHPRYAIKHHGDRFVLATPRAYQSVQYLTKDVPFFPGAHRSASSGMLPAGSYVAVVASGPEWEEVERFAQDGTPTHGWIDRDDLDDVKWVDQRATTKQFRFRVAFTAGASDNDPATAVAIEVLDRATGKRVQVIRDFYADPWGESDTSLTLVDANFDGHPDLMIGGSSGGAGPNSTDNFFLFDPKSRRFVFDQALSDLPQIGFDAHRKQVTSAHRNSCCSHSSETWRYEGGHLVEIANWDESLSADGAWLVTTIGHLRNGKMRYRVTRKRAELN